MIKLVPFLFVLFSAISATTIEYASHAPGYDFGFQLFTAKQELYFQKLVNTDLGCLRYQDKENCGHYPKNVRKEVRRMTNEERQRYFTAVYKLKHDDKIDGTSRYDLFMYKHLLWNAPGSTKGPAFLGFHRIMTRALEVALQQIDPDVTIPYWDVTLDSELPDPRDSVLWTADLLGNGDGNVVTGPFAYLPVIKVTNAAVEKDKPVDVEGDLEMRNPDEIEHQKIIPAHLYRGVGANKTITLWTRDYIEKNVLTKSFNELNFCYDGTFEMMHGHPHYWIGGEEFPGETTAPEDPYFLNYHSFIDYLWYQYRERTQDKKQRETEYGDVEGPNCQPSKDEQLLNRAVLPFFPYTNRDGLSEAWTDYIYQYERSPGKCTADEDCQSDFLFCNHHAGRCMSKVQPGGSCKGLEDHKYSVCYKSGCTSNGRCWLTHEPYNNYPPNAEKIIPRAKNGMEPTTSILTYVHQSDTTDANFPMKLVVEGISYNGITEYHLDSNKLSGDYQQISVPSFSKNGEETVVAVRAFDSFGRVCVCHCPALDRGHPEEYRHTPASPNSYVPCVGILRLTSPSTRQKRSVTIKNSKTDAEIRGERLLNARKFAWDVPFETFENFNYPKRDNLDAVPKGKGEPDLLFMCRHSVFKQYEDVEMADLLEKLRK